MLPNTPQCTGRPHKNQNYPASNVSSAEPEKAWLTQKPTTSTSSSLASFRHFVSGAPNLAMTLQGSTNIQKTKCRLRKVKELAQTQAERGRCNLNLGYMTPCHTHAVSVMPCRTRNCGPWTRGCWASSLRLPPHLSFPCLGGSPSLSPGKAEDTSQPLQG